MKKCPFCAEEIQDDAVKCKHCGEFLIDAELKEPKEGRQRQMVSQDVVCRYLSIVFRAACAAFGAV